MGLTTGLRLVVILCMVIFWHTYAAMAMPATSSAIAGNISDISSAANGTDDVGRTPWPPAPFRVPNGDPSAYGYLSFDNLGPPSTTLQRVTFERFMDLISRVLREEPARVFEDYVAVIEKDWVHKIYSLFWELHMAASPGQSPALRRDADRFMTTVVEQVKEHFLVEFTANLEEDPRHLEGGMQLLLEPSKSIPRTKPIYVWIHGPSKATMIEITSFQDPGDISDGLRALSEAIYRLRGLPGQSQFEGGIITSGSFTLSVQPSHAPSQMFWFTNEVALAVALTLSQFEVGFRSGLEFNVWLQDNVATSLVWNIGYGSLVKQTGVGNDTGVFSSGVSNSTVRFLNSGSVETS